jgi:hypothetical protein
MPQRRRYLVHRCDGRGGADCVSSNGENGPVCAGCGRAVGDCWFYAAFDERWDWICVCSAKGIRTAGAGHPSGH